LVGREQFLANMFTYFKNAVHNSPPAKEYLQSRNLDFKKIEVGYNAGLFHHGARKDENLNMLMRLFTTDMVVENTLAMVMVPTQIIAIII